MKYAVLGNPVAHSLSPIIHQQFAKQAGITLDYQKIEVNTDEFATVVRDFFDSGGRGCNITVPFKHQAFFIADKVSDDAAMSQAVNCLSLGEDGFLWGDNFDGVGLVQDLIFRLEYRLKNKSLLIIGAGGAVCGILPALLQEKPQRMVIANRSVDKARVLAERFAVYGNVIAVPLDTLGDESFDLIIHATSLGYQGQVLTLPASIMSASSVCYDLSYGKAAMPFLKAASKIGVKGVYEGLGMLVEQAAASFFRWHGFYPSTQEVLFSRSLY